ncbi:unnamed protein product [Effrenium voratum]|uniref:MGAT4 conserved region domain-containing protein n=1 Tax=Effrenium voratum TaxID=2562239 RepID=A0AA36JNU9_9DINO|nr:unnamed protein product [Effrenium voratum]CAJ1434185.1 unnamed protein product [Effrenium voratum]
MPARGSAILHLPCAIFAIVLILINEVLLSALPVLQKSSTQTYTPSDIKLPPAVSAENWFGCKGEDGLAEPEATSWSDLGNSLSKLDPDSLRILPGKDGKIAAGARRWMTFGMSSIKRPKASYLGITLSRMFNVLDLDEAKTAIIVHLADFDEEWVLQTASWLRDSFTSEVGDGRLQAIHAPRSLYPLKQADLKALDLSGFYDSRLNTKYFRQEKMVGGHVTYATQGGQYLLFWCSQQPGAAGVAHRRWVVAAADWESVQQARGCGSLAVARAPEEMEVLDPIIKGWEEWKQDRWQAASGQAGISHLDLKEGELLKFGDSPKRQWWRTKQNLDYTFLMWYSAGLSDYYMQLEDDIQPVPHFILSVRSYITRSLLGQHWVMASFSSLGFIGKMFNTSHLPSLAQFLLTFSTEAPCDWLVWVWIDAMSPWPVTPDIPKDVEKEKEKRDEAAKQGKEAMKKLGSMRDDLQPYYLNLSSWPKLFQSAEASIITVKTPLPVNGAVDPNFHNATVVTNMIPYEAFMAKLVYPHGDPMGFWTSDTCKDRKVQGCQLGKKYLRLIFEEPLSDTVKVSLRQSRPGHEADFIRQGSLLSSKDVSCGKPVRLKALAQPEETWEGPLDEVRCLEVTLDKGQEEWIAIREILVETPRKLIESETRPYPSHTSASHSSYALRHALAAAVVGFLSGTMAWLVIWYNEGTVRSVGCFAPWTMVYLLLLDAGMLSIVQTQPIPPARLEFEPATTSGAPVASNEIGSCKKGRRSRGLPMDWRLLQSGIALVDERRLKHLGPAKDPRQGPVTKHRVSIGVIAEAEMDAAAVADAVLALLARGSGQVTVAVLVANQVTGRRHELVRRLQGTLAERTDEAYRDLVHLLDPSPALYPERPARTANVDLALLARFLEPLAETFMVVEPMAALVPNYFDHMKRYIDMLESSGIPWIVVEFSPQGYRRKLVRSRLLRRFQEMLLMFPEAPADLLFWDFIDVVGNETAPKSIYLGTDAGKRWRPDVKLQHNKVTAILEHLGDVSSLEGKVQRAQESYFKQHKLVDSLFDNPPAKLYTNMPETRPEILQSVYDGSEVIGQVTCGGHSAKSCSECPQGHGASWCNLDCGWVEGSCKALFRASAVSSHQDLWLELVFEEPQDVEIVNLRMGGTVKPPCDKCKDTPGAESPDDDFNHALDDAEMLLGQGFSMGSACSRYFKVQNVVGREVFWKSNHGRAEKSIRCIKISLPRAQQHPLILRALDVRTSKAGYDKAAKLAAAGFNVPVRARFGLSLRGSQFGVATEASLWQEQHLEWVLLLSVALVSGAFAGVLGCLRPRPKRRKVAASA